MNRWRLRQLEERADRVERNAPEPEDDRRLTDILGVELAEELWAGLHSEDSMERVDMARELHERLCAFEEGDDPTAPIEELILRRRMRQLEASNVPLAVRDAEVRAWELRNAQHRGLRRAGMLRNSAR